jgi:3-oxoacyl-[acyl-carrier protein] reductase
MRDPDEAAQVSSVVPVRRVVLVTGGSRGIGLATARAFAAAGDRVAITYNTTPPPDGDELFAVACDVTDADQVEAAFAAIEAELGPVEVLVSNAGVTRDGLMVRMGDDDFSDVIDANLAGGFRVAKRAVVKMMRARWGRIIFLSSVVAHTGSAGQANYAASKAGLVGLARSMAREFGSRHVTVNVVAPGPIATDMLDALADDRRDAITALVPLGRLGTPGEVASTICFLASEEAAYITGALIPVDGGMGMGT